jgi:hypothetical protein
VAEPRGARVKMPTRNTTLRPYGKIFQSYWLYIALFTIFQFFLVAYFAYGDTVWLRQIFSVITPLLGALFGALGFYLASRRESESDQEWDLALTVDISTDIAKAAESLTAADVVKRIAGIYALESLAGSVPGSQKVAVNILSAFVRERSSPQITQIKDWQRSSREASSSDIELALKSLSSLNSEALRVRIDLRGAQLVSANLSNLNLSRADLSGAVLDGSDLSFCDLTQASLRSTSLVGSRLDGANLTAAVLDKTDLTKASLVSTNLTGALIRSANMRGAYVVRANFSDALLGEVDLTGAHLRDVEIKSSGDRTENSQLGSPGPHVAELRIDGFSSDSHGEKL